ncbi:MAG: cytochrome b/b6 domain-containing protein [bacterium]|nr:cytochrome b/b6 domain-containing protein [bacterium]
MAARSHPRSRRLRYQRTMEHPHPSPARVYRHPLVVRATHWIMALSMLVLVMSGLQIFNAHPALYASDASTFGHPLLALPKAPWWLTLPAYQDLADGRRWHIFFAWVFGLCALLYARWAWQLVPNRADLSRILPSLKEHLTPWRLRAERRANPLQKSAYFAVVFSVAPLAIVSGLALSPAIDAWAPWLPALFGGRQFARAWHFAAMLGLLGFIAGHLAMIALTGPLNQLRSMITGWLDVGGAP